jgi:hypothetical protein
MITYRPLTINDCDELINLLQLRPYIFNNYTDADFKNTITSSAPKWFLDPTFFVPGIFINGELTGAMVLKESSSAPVWTWGHWIHKPGHVAKMYSEEGVRVFKEADQLVFDEMEVARKLNRVYVAYNMSEGNQGLKAAGMSDRMLPWMRRQGFRIANYKFYTDCIVEPNTMPRYSYQKDLILNRTWPIKVALRIGMLQSSESGS